MRAKAWLQAALLALAGWWIYFPALHGGWIWDDRTDITQNTVLRDPAGWWKIWFAPESLDYYPLKTSVQWVQWRLWGLDSFGYHLTNLGLHVLSGFLIWRLLTLIFAPKRGSFDLRAQDDPSSVAWIGGLLFVVHPLAVESVAWVVELKNTLSLPLVLGAMIAYATYDDRRWCDVSRRRPAAPNIPNADSVHWASWGLSRRSPAKTEHVAPPYLASLILFILAMLSKTSVVMFPVVILLYAWWRRGRIGRRDLKASAPFFAVSLALGLVTIWLQQHRTIGAAVVPMGGLPSRFAGAGLSAAFYFWKFIFPVGLSPVYGRWAVDPPAVWQFWPWVVVIVLGWNALSPTRWGQRVPPLLFGVGFFLLNLAPILGFVTVSFMRFTSVMDHMTYLPMIGLVGLAAAGAGRAERFFSGLVFDAQSKGNPLFPSRLRFIFWGLVASVIALLALDSRRHALIFRNEETLWTRAIEVRPDAWPAHNNLGIALADSGRLTEAIAQYDEALRIEPGNAETHYNLGLVLAREGRTVEAIAQYQTALRLEAGFLGAYFSLGDALAAEQKWPEAIAAYQEAVRLEPRHIEAHNNLGNALNHLGRVPEAIAQFQAALALDPDDAEAHNNLGVALAETGRLPEAIVQFRQALRLRPDYANAQRNLQRALGSASR